jgi:tetratricopeptide (TPR) repeat protein
LGYINHTSVKENFSVDPSKEDPKDLIGFHNDFYKFNKLINQKKLADVRSLGDRLIEQRPQFCQLYDLLLGTALNQKDYQAAIGYGEKALELKPDRFNEHYILGIAYTQSKQNDQAVRHFEAALEFMPKDQAYYQPLRVETHNRLGFLRSEQKKFELAIVRFKDSLKLNPAQPITLNGLAVAYANSNNLSEAIKTSEKAIALAKTKGEHALAARLEKQLEMLKKY